MVSRLGFIFCFVYISALLLLLLIPVTGVGAGWWSLLLFFLLAVVVSNAGSDVHKVGNKFSIARCKVEELGALIGRLSG